MTGTSFSFSGDSISSRRSSITLFTTPFVWRTISSSFRKNSRSGAAVELRPVRPECNAERCKDVPHLLEIQPDIHGGLDRPVLMTADKDTRHLPLGQAGLVEMVEIFQAGRPVEKDLEACRHAVPVDWRGDDDCFRCDKHLVEGGRIVVLVPGRKGAGLGPHGITTPAGIDAVLAQVIPAITHTPFTEILFGNVGHITGIPGAVRAAVDQQDIEWLAIMGEWFLSVS